MVPLRERSVRVAVLAGAAMVSLAVLVVVAFAFGLVGGEPTIVDQVPDSADGVLRIDPGILDDPASAGVLTAGLAALGYPRMDPGEAMGTFESRTGLSLSAVDDVAAFGRYSAGGGLDVRYAGVIVHANWSGTDIRDALGRTRGVEYETATVNGHTVYQPAIEDVARAPTIGVLADGEFVIGTPLSVDDAIAVAEGEADSLSGPVRSSLSGTGDGLVTGAAAMPREQIEAFDARTGGLTRLGSIRAVAGTYDTEGDVISITVRLRASGTEAAHDVTDVARGGVPIIASTVDNETVAKTLRAVTVDREGSTVTLRLETSPDALRTMARYYGLGGS